MDIPQGPFFLEKMISWGSLDMHFVIFNVFFKIRSNSGNLIKANTFIARAPIVYHSNAFYVFGGYVDGSYSKTIGRLDASTLTWTKAGELNYARYGHGAIYNGERIIVAGGYGNYKTESCSVNENGVVNCIEQAPTLNKYADYPEMYLVDDAFCKDN